MLTQPDRRDHATCSSSVLGDDQRAHTTFEDLLELTMPRCSNQQASKTAALTSQA